MAKKAAAAPKKDSKPMPFQKGAAKADPKMNKKVAAKKSGKC